MAPKRACDICIARKIKCSGSWPCDSCRSAIKRVPCTYFRPARKRGPKGRRPAGSHQQEIKTAAAGLQDDVQGVQENICYIGQQGTFARISKDVLSSVVRLYQHHSYSVWPVVNADALLQKLVDIEPDKTTGNTSRLATALCAATMAQLQLPPFDVGDRAVDGAELAQACLWMREHENSQIEHYPDISSILVSFFLHVYYAKVNQPTRAMMFIQEAIARAQILGLDERQTNVSGLDGPLIANCELVFPLLWVSER
ncbi:hypothetical protein N7474_001173 [Penicillium riverlandense]|uniref:uncharacterized protein n=1 Tax=Penicillium riverlandense TaxID=1903569 RepID=UPI0025468735|nr:uncharacterized protein N7474_001173 [Penicillium riverlandense]KAJ5832862.1 hypothetical protein N7474_001173 [Penicillium riverlandense]